jgi:hypothetical protein
MCSWRSASMRITTVTALLAVSLMSSAAMAQGKAAPETRGPNSSLSQVYSAEESAALAAKARQKTEGMERARDRKMRQISKEICTGC